jgi:hypothetical protein
MGIKFDESKRKWFKLKQRPNKKGLKADSIGTYPLVDLIGKDNLLKWDPATMSKTDWTQNKFTRIGADMLVPTDSTYKMTLYYRQYVTYVPYNSPVVQQFSSDFTLPAPHIDANYDEASGRWIYKPGKIYYVRIAVYGLMKTKFVVDLDPWGQGEEIEIDTEEQAFW